MFSHCFIARRYLRAQPVLLIDSEFIPKTEYCHPSEMTELTIGDGRYGLVSCEAMHARSETCPI